MNDGFVDKNVIGKETTDIKARPLFIKFHKGGKEPVIFGRKQDIKLKRRRCGNTYKCPKVTGPKQTKLTDKFHRIKPKLSRLQMLAITSQNCKNLLRIV